MAHSEKKHPQWACMRVNCGLCGGGIWRRRASRRRRAQESAEFRGLVRAEVDERQRDRDRGQP